MNMNQNPTTKQLAALLASVDDWADHHKLWVGVDGQVHLDSGRRWNEWNPHNISFGGRAATLSEYALAESAEHDTIQFEMEMCIQGNGYTGWQAALDGKYVRREFSLLSKAWRHGHRGLLDCDLWPGEEVTDEPASQEAGQRGIKQ